MLKRFIFDERFLRIDRFRSEQAKIQQIYIGTKETIEKNVAYQLEGSLTNLNISNITKLLRLSSTPKDIHFLIDIIRKLVVKEK